MPGVQSLEKRQYYGHPQNKFWYIMFELLDEPPTADYNERINMLKRHRIALWDTIDSCERKGSLDAEIRNEVNNDVPGLLNQQPSILATFCNGQKSYKNLLKELGKNHPYNIFCLPSTSPLHTMSFEKKLAGWSAILDFL